MVPHELSFPPLIPTDGGRGDDGCMDEDGKGNEMMNKKGWGDGGERDLRCRPVEDEEKNDDGRRVLDEGNTVHMV